MRLQVPQPTFNSTVTIAFFIVVFGSACLMPLQIDTWWHLRAGHEMWSRHFLMLKDEFSFTAAGAYWPNHEWLSEIVFYLAYRIGGLPGLTALGAICLTGALALSWSLMRGTSVTKLFLMTAATSSFVPVWTVRPHVFTLLFMMVLVHLLLRHWFLPLPVLFAVWANLHGGVALGLIVLGAMSLSEGWIAGRGAFLKMLVVSGACFAATLATPLGVDLWMTIPESVQKSMANGIAEWRPPILFGWRDLGFWVTALVLLGVIARRRAIKTRHDASVVFISLALLPLALRYSRNITPFVLMALPAISRVMPSIPDVPARAARPEHYGVNTTLLGACAVLCIVAVVSAWTVHAGRLQWEPVSQEIIEGIRSCPGRLYNRFDDGGLVIWFVPEVRVFVDNRQDPYPLAFLQDHLLRERSGDFEEAFARYSLKCAFLPPESPTAQRLLSSGWRVTARDSRWLVLMGR